MPFHEAEHGQSLMHEKQQTERCRPGEKHHAKAQQATEYLLGVNAQGLKHHYRKNAKEEQYRGVALCQHGLVR